jgi:hypothetical protein
MSGIIVGGCSALLHAVAAYPKAAVCVAILGLGTANVVLTDAQMAECDAKIAACKPVPPAPPVPIVIAPPVAPPVTVAVVPVKPVVVDPCADAPVISTADLFVSTGKPFLWKNPGIDPVRGKDAKPYLAQLRFTPAEQKVFLEKIAKQDGTMATLKKGDVIGLMTSGSGGLKTNTTVAFDPIAQTGNNHKNDNRLRVYTHEQLVRLNGDCVLRQMVLLEPFVCQNWARLSDVISPYPKK